MKKLVSIILILCMTLALSACSTKENAANNGYELALITDVGTIDDKSFNQGAWEGVKAYADEFSKTYKYYKPTEKSTNAYNAAITLAVEGGAKVIVCPGFYFEEAMHIAQDEYPDVKFIILDAQPRSTDGDDRINENVLSIYYAEEQAGFLAGYAAVKDGYKKLGFMGGIKAPSVVRFGYGFVEGAEYAAKEMGITDIDVKYTYTGTFEAKPEVQATAAAWYQSGTEVIFACGGGIGNSIMKAAESYNGKVIGVDVDQSVESETVITSAMKVLSGSVYDAIDSVYKGTFKGGQSITRDVSEQGVSLPMETSKFNTFTEEDYKAIYSTLGSGEIKLATDKDAEDVTELNLEHVNVQEIH